VELGSQALLLDLGQGSLGSLWAFRDPSTLEGIVISHMHPDHHVDLVPLRHQLRWGMGTAKRVPLWAPQLLRERYDAFMGELDFLGAAFDGGEVRPGSFELGPFRVEARSVLHSLNSHAYRVSVASDPSAPGLVYSGDCASWRDLVPLVRPGDTLLSEAFWGVEEADPGAMHMTADDAARVGVEGGAARLIMTHIAEEHDPQAALVAARNRFGAEVQLATPGLIVEVR
jgi:ribonuclease BN (tRNA processing enzyme)